jgi:hypothetical protein
MDYKLFDFEIFFQFSSVILAIYISSVSLYTWDIRHEHTLRVFENRMLRRVFGPKRDEVTGGWRKMHNEELHNFHSSPSIIRITKYRVVSLSGHVA